MVTVVKRKNPQHSSESNEWYSSSDAMDFVWDVMGAPELDPASCEEANEGVGAKRILTIHDDGLSKPWKAKTLYLNPPFGKTGNVSNVAIWLEKLFDEYSAGNIGEAMVLLNATTDREWFQDLWKCWICFLDKRVRFWRPEELGPAHQPTHGNVMVYLGPDATKFATKGDDRGHVVAPYTWREILRSTK